LPMAQAMGTAIAASNTNIGQLVRT
jgi:hypothetical protein